MRVAGGRGTSGKAVGRRETTKEAVMDLPSSIRWHREEMDEEDGEVEEELIER